MQQYILEEQLEVICDEDGRDYEEVVELEKEVMLRLHQANSIVIYLSFEGASLTEITQ